MKSSHETFFCSHLIGDERISDNQRDLKDINTFVLPLSPLSAQFRRRHHSRQLRHRPIHYFIKKTSKVPPAIASRAIIRQSGDKVAKRAFALLPTIFMPSSQLKVCSYALVV